MKKERYSIGDIVNVNLGAPPKEVIGHEQGYSRPCMVVRPFNNLKLAIIVPITTSKSKVTSFFFAVPIPKGVGGLTFDSHALCHQVRTVSFTRIKEKRGRMDVDNVNKIKAVLVDLIDS